MSQSHSVPADGYAWGDADSIVGSGSKHISSLSTDQLSEWDLFLRGIAH